MNKILSILMLSLFSFGIIFAEDYACEEYEQYEECSEGVCVDSSSCYLASLSYHIGRGIGYDKSYGSYSFFGAPFQYKRIQAFFDLRSHLFNSGGSAANAGVGFRYQADCWTLGTNFYYDVRNHHDRKYEQLGAGLEFLSPCVDVRVNGYFPLNDKTHIVQCTTFNYLGGYFERCKLREFAYGGYDGEVGRCLYTSACCPCYFSIYAAAGAYYLHSKHSCNNVWGAQVRAKVSVTQFLALEVWATSDPLFNQRMQGIITLSVPFGPCSTSCSCAPACLPPVRREIIPLDKYCNYRGNF